jgi:hypothetical protein
MSLIKISRGVKAFYYLTQSIQLFNLHKNKKELYEISEIDHSQ